MRQTCTLSLIVDNDHCDDADEDDGDEDSDDVIAEVEETEDIDSHVSYGQPASPGVCNMC